MNLFLIVNRDGSGYLINCRPDHLEDTMAVAIAQDPGLEGATIYLLGFAHTHMPPCRVADVANVHRMIPLNAITIPSL